MIRDCEWPFCNKPNCWACQEMDAKYGQNIDDYLATLVEIREAKKRERKQRDIS